jgi:hypothetical protein
MQSQSSKSSKTSRKLRLKTYNFSIMCSPKPNLTRLLLSTQNNWAIFSQQLFLRLLGGVFLEEQDKLLR